MAGLWRRAASIGGLLFGAAVLSACGDGTQVVRMDPRPPSTLADAVRAGDVEEVKARLLRDGRVEPTSKPVNEALTLAVEASIEDERAEEPEDEEPTDAEEMPPDQAHVDEPLPPEPGDAVMP